MANLPGRSIPGYEGRYSMTEDGTVWYAAGGAFRPLKPQRTCYVHLRTDGGRATGRLTCHSIHALYEQTWGRALDKLPAYPPPGYDGPPPPAPEPDECGYEPLPGMTPDEAWPEEQQRRVLWGLEWGTAIGARGWRWWVRLDGEDAPRLIAAGALTVSPGPEWEAAQRAAVAAHWAAMARDVRAELRHTGKTRGALGRGDFAGRKVVAG